MPARNETIRTFEISPDPMLDIATQCAREFASLRGASSEEVCVLDIVPYLLYTDDPHGLGDFIESKWQISREIVCKTIEDLIPNETAEGQCPQDLDSFMSESFSPDDQQVTVAAIVFRLINTGSLGVLLDQLSISRGQFEREYVKRYQSYLMRGPESRFGGIRVIGTSSIR